MTRKQSYISLREIYNSLLAVYSDKKTSLVYVSLVALGLELDRLYKNMAVEELVQAQGEPIIIPPPPDPEEPEE